MSVHPTPLAQQVAHIRGAILTQEKCVWIPAVVHALIIACLARIFGRLEEMIRLWQSGQLPLPPAPRPYAPRAACATPRVHHWPTARPRHAMALPIPESASATAPRHAPAAPFPTLPTPCAGPNPIHAQSRHARAPPPNRRAHSAKNPSHRDRVSTPISLRYKNKLISL